MEPPILIFQTVIIFIHLKIQEEYLGMTPHGLHLAHRRQTSATEFMTDIIESIDSEDRRSSIGEHRQSKHHTVSIVKVAIQLSFNQGAALPATVSYGEFSLLLENQHQKAENRLADSNRAAPVPLAPVTPARKPRQVTPKSTGTTGLEKPSGKRKYVRKKKTDVDTPSTEIRETSGLGDRSVQRSAKRALNFDLEAQLNDGLEPFSLASVCNIESREHNDGRLSNNSGSNRNKLPISNGLEEVVEAAKFMFDHNNPTNTVSGNCAGPYENSDQHPAPSRRENLNYLARKRELVNMRILSSGHAVHQSTPESIFTSNSSLHLSFADDAAVKEGLKRTCNLSCSAADQSHQDVIVSNYYMRQTENSINDMSSYEYNGDQVNHLSEMNKKKRKADGEMELTSNGIHFLPRGRGDLNCPFEEEFACAKKLVAIGRQQDAEQLIAYVQTERKRTELSKAPTQVCSQLASTPTKSYDYKHVSSNVGSLGEGKTIPVTPRRQKKSHLSSEQACQQESEISASSTRKEPQKIQTSPIKSKWSHRNHQEKLDSSSPFRVMAPPVDPIDLIVQKLKGLIISEGHEENAIEGLQPQNALVLFHGDGTMVPFEGPLGPSRKRLPRAKVDLDSETNRVWMLLMGKEANDSAEALGKDKKKWWEEERRVFRGRVDSFIARMHLVQGDRRFSQWKGSVVDSVVGVFLTQNVSDHLSSSAFMALAARFPSESSGKSRESSIVNESIPTTNQVMTIVEIEDEFKLQDNMSSHLLDQRTSTFEKTYDTEEKGIEDVETPGRNTGDSLFDISNERNMDEFGEEKEPDVSSLTNRILAPLSLRQQMNSAEVDDVRSLENGISSQNSVVSSQNSSDSTTVDLVGLNLESNTDIEGILNGPRWNCLDASTPFMELLQLAGAGMFQELYPSRSGSAASKGSLANANNALESAGPEERRPGIDPIFKLNDACTSDNGVKSHELCNVTRLPCVPSTSHFHSASVSELIGIEGTDASRKGPPFFTSFRSESINTTCITNSSSMSPLVKEKTEISGQEESLSTSQSLFAVDSCRNTSQCSSKPLTSSRREIDFDENLPNHTYILREQSESISNTNTPHKGLASSDGQTGKHEQKEREAILQKSAKGASDATAQSLDYRTFELHSESTQCASTLDNSKSSNAIEKDREVSARTIGWMPANGSCTIPDAPKVTAKDAVKPVSKKSEKERKDNFDWDSLRKEVCKSGSGKERSSSTMDSIDWEAIRNADVKEISNTIRERGMNNMLAERIKAFLDRLVREHGSIDLEWLRDVPPDKAKDYLLSIRGLGLKSVECVRLLTLHHLAFPVDTNVGRICVRLGWVPLQPLPESLQLHLLELYPMLETIQKYLWPRLCTLDQRTLYELHYQLITFGKVFCTKSKPNCNACPMRGECKHFASAFASARLALPGPEEKGLVPMTNPAASEMAHKPAFYPTPLPQLEVNPVSQGAIINNSEPIIEEPASPEPECLEYLESAIEDFNEDPDEIPTIKLNIEQFTQNLQDIFQGNNIELQDGDMSKALVALTPDVASIPQPKLKNVSRLRTEHQVYELPDFHPLLEGLDQREVDDPCPYLLAIWTPGETAQSTEPPDITCTAQDMGKLCDRKTCFGCNSIREARAQKVRGTLLVPCRTAMRGSFPLNGTYFQVNEVFADHCSSLSPIDVPRDWLWNLPRRTVYFGTSVTSIFRGLTTEGIQQCFWRGFVCVRGFDQKTRAPRPLLARLHFPANKAIRNKKIPANEE